MPEGLPSIPETITVHLGAPDSNAPNVTLPFLDYVMNVASSEIYPTWPEDAIRANIYAQVSFALNRIYTEYYRSRGYDFDITNSTQFDQYFVNGRDIFENIQTIAAELFNDYIQRQGNVEPLFAQYCNGTTVTCQGLSQWGTVDLARQGNTPYDILRNYYGNDINIVFNAPTGNIPSSVPPSPLRLGSTGDDVRAVQIRLNRISDNYSSIPKITSPDGIFSFDTEAAVRRFQEIFNLTPDGIIGPATWNTILRIYAAVKRLNSLNSEGLELNDISQQYTGALSLGDTGNSVSNLQYFLSVLAAYYESIPAVAIDGVFGETTRDAVFAAQRTFGLPIDGLVGEDTWNAINSAYQGIVSRISPVFTDGAILPYPGVPLRQGNESESVRILQEYLNYISQFIPEIPAVSPTGYFGARTQASVEAFQRLYGITPPVAGQVGAETWNAIANLYSDLFIGSRLNEGQFPGRAPGA